MKHTVTIILTLCLMLSLLTVCAGAATGSDTSQSSPAIEPYKLIVCAAVLLLGALACLVPILTKKTSAKNFIAIGVSVAVLVSAVLLIDIRLPDDYYGQETESLHDVVGTVTLTIRCDSVPDLGSIEHLPDDGMILVAETFELQKGETVYDILIRAARKHTLHVDTDGTGQAAYVLGLQHLYNGDMGDLSGWAYSVNGESPMVGCGAYVLSDGDQICWEYSLNLWGE